MRSRFEELSRIFARLKRSDEPVRVAALAESRDKADEAIRQLPHKQRDAAGLVLLVGLSFREAGECLGVTGDTVRLRIRRAFPALRHRLASSAGFA